MKESEGGDEADRGEPAGLAAPLAGLSAPRLNTGVDTAMENSVSISYCPEEERFNELLLCDRALLMKWCSCESDDRRSGESRVEGSLEAPPKEAEAVDEGVDGSDGTSAKIDVVRSAISSHMSPTLN